MVSNLVTNYDSAKPHLLMKIAQGDLESTIQILQAGYPINEPIEPNLGRTLLMQACIYEQEKILHWLLEKTKTDVNI